MKNIGCQLILALLSLWEGLQAAPLLKPKPVEPRAELDSIRKMTNLLLVDTKKLYHHFKAKYPAEGEHKLETLPTLSMNAVDLANIQVASGLAKLSVDLHIYQRHFDWLRKAAHIVRPLDHEFGTIHNGIEKLNKRMEHLMTKLNLQRPSDPALPQMPTSVTQWSVVQTGHALFHNFHLFLDWASRVLVVVQARM
ncbi:interleukin-11 isoform X2 [Ambystoma mexicanum]|uniref:interleukin-11 isoform X2 n=1 Tax=Ambystoma mexicanum TaxID=8296 RepID=UPI0037E93624